jgi:tRNA-specific 2-thiouridylase
VKIRYQHVAAAADVTGIDATRFEVAFDEPQSAITPGQAAVVYGDGGVLLGGGRIVVAR